MWEGNAIGVGASGGGEATNAEMEVEEVVVLEKLSLALPGSLSKEPQKGVDGAAGIFAADPRGNRF